MIRDAAVRPLTAADLNRAFSLSATAGWNQRVDDWRMLLRLAPDGCFAAVAGDRLIGTAIGIDYKTFGWIAMMLVDPSWRGRGLGGRLLEAAMSAVPADLPIRLDATPLGRPLYQRYGFADETTLTRHVREGGRDAGNLPGADARARPLTTSDIDTVAEQDLHAFGGERRAVIEWAWRGAPEYSYIVDSGSGFCLGRQGRLFDQIGPVVAGDDDAARALVGAALRASGDRPVAIDAFDAERGFAEWLHTVGFGAQRPLFRMRKSSSPWSAPPRGPAAEVAILGPEFA